MKEDVGRWHLFTSGLCALRWLQISARAVLSSHGGQADNHGAVLHPDLEHLGQCV